MMRNCQYSGGKLFTLPWSAELQQEVYKCMYKLGLIAHLTHVYTDLTHFQALTQYSYM